MLNAEYLKLHFFTLKCLFQRVVLKFTKFDVQQCTGCSCDKIIIYQRQSIKGRFIKCGNKLPEHQVSYHRKFYMEFRTDKTATSGGFTVEYSTEFGRKYQLCGHLHIVTCTIALTNKDNYLFCRSRPFNYCNSISAVKTMLF